MPQLDIVSYFSQFFWFAIFYVGLFFYLSNYQLPLLNEMLLIRKMNYKAKEQSNQDEHIKQSFLSSCLDSEVFPAFKRSKVWPSVYCNGFQSLTHFSFNSNTSKKVFKISSSYSSNEIKMSSLSNQNEISSNTLNPYKTLGLVISSMGSVNEHVKTALSLVSSQNTALNLCKKSSSIVFKRCLQSSMAVTAKEEPKAKGKPKPKKGRKAKEEPEADWSPNF